MQRKSLLEIILKKEKMLDGFPTNEIDSPKEFTKLSNNEKIDIIAWLTGTFKPTKSNNYSKSSSYAIKHIFENSILGFYVCNGAFKGAMLIAGYKPVEKYLNSKNWLFHVSNKSVSEQFDKYRDNYKL